MNKANKAILFSTLTAPAFARTLCPLLSEIDVNDRTCSGYQGPCVFEPVNCCGQFVGYGGEAYCEYGVGWEFIPLDVPMCADDCGSQERRLDWWDSSHDATTDSTHNRDTWKSDEWGSNSGDSWASKRDASHDVWSDAATESWRESTPGWVKTRDTASTSDRTKSTENLWDSNKDGSSWVDRDAETWDDRARESETSADWTGATWRDREATRKGSKNNEEWGTVKFDMWGNPITSTGTSTEHKNRETTSDEWGTTGLWGEETGSRHTDDRHHHKSDSTTEVDEWGNTKHSSSSKTSTSSSTKTSSSSSSWGRRRATDGLADRLAEAEAVDVEPKLGNYMSQLLAPSSL